MRTVRVIFAGVMVVCFVSGAFAYEWASTPRIGGHDGGSEGEITEFDGIAKEDFPVSPNHLKALVNMEYTLKATRASGDMDTRRPDDPCAGPPVFVADSLKNGWPRW